MAHIDITDKIGFALLKKGVIDYETLEKSLKVKDGEDRKNRRNLGQILVNDFGADHDAVFREVADLYAFREIYLQDEQIDKIRVDFIRRFVDALGVTHLIFRLFFPGTPHAHILRELELLAKHVIPAFR